MSEQPKRLYRSRDERMLAGVCGGLGEYLNTDPTIIRIVFIIVALIGFIGGGIILYLALWLIIPEEPLSTSPSTPAAPAAPSAAAEPQPVAEAQPAEEPVAEESSEGAAE
jgi:phage shock protein C